MIRLKLMTPGLLALALALSWTTTATAQNTPAKAPVALTEQDHVPPWCGVRAPMHFVIGYDEGKRFFLTEEKARSATAALLDASCPGDKVRIASFGMDVTWKSDTVTLQNRDDKAKVLDALKRRGQLTAPAAINDNLVKAAMTQWENAGEDGELPVLVVFTDTIESSAPRRPGQSDFAWTEVPDWFQGRFLTLVALMDHRSARDIAALYTTTAPPDKAIEDFPANPRATFSDVMQSFMPEPEPEKVEPKVIVRTVETTRSPDWLVWLGTLEGSVTAGGAVFALLSLIFLLGRVSRRRREDSTKALPTTIEGTHREVTLILRDRLTEEVLRQETRVLREPVRVAPGSTADFVVPGPYAFEIVDDGGESPIIRSNNMLGVELARGAGRRIVVPEGQSQALRTSDRVDIGAGHEVEIQIH